MCRHGRATRRPVRAMQDANLNHKLFKRVCICHVPCVGTPALSGLRWSHPQAHRALNPSAVGVGQEAWLYTSNRKQTAAHKIHKGNLGSRSALKGISLGGRRGQRGVGIESPAPLSWAKLPASSAKTMRQK